MGVSISSLSRSHAVAMKSHFGEALVAIRGPHHEAHVQTEVCHAIEAAASLQVPDGPLASTQELNRAAEQLRLTVSSTATAGASIFHFAAAAAAAYHWVWVVTTVATSHPTLIGKQEYEVAGLAADLTFEQLPVQLTHSCGLLCTYPDGDAELEPEHTREVEAAILVATAAAGAAAAGLLELQEWVREGVVPVALPTDTPNLASLVEALAQAAPKIMFGGGDPALRKWVVEEGVLPFLYCATLHTAQADVVAHVLTPHPGQPNCLKALVQYLEEEMQAVLGTFSNPWQAPQLEPLVLAVSLVAMWPGSMSNILQELDHACLNHNKMAMVALELCEKMWVYSKEDGEHAERLVWEARAAAAAQAFCVTCLRGRGTAEKQGEIMTTSRAGIAPAALVAVAALEQLAAWAAPNSVEQGLHHSIKRYVLQQATLRQLLVLLSCIKDLRELLEEHLAGQSREYAPEISGIQLAGGLYVAPILDGLARLSGFLAQQRQQGGFAALGFARFAERLGMRFEDGMDAAIFKSAVHLECTLWAALELDKIDWPISSAKPLAWLLWPQKLYLLAHALAARTNVLLAPQAPGAGSPIVDRKACAKLLAPSFASASQLVHRCCWADGGSAEEHIRSYSAIAWVLTPAAAALLRLAAEEGCGDGAEQLVKAFSSLALAGLGDMVARCGGGAVLHLGFEVPEHDVMQRTNALIALGSASGLSPGLCVSLGREGFLEKLVETAPAFAASRHGTAVTRSKHLQARLSVLATVCSTVDNELGDRKFMPVLLAVDGVSHCITSEDISAQLRSRLKERRLWEEVKTAVEPLVQRCGELYEEACQQEETCVLRDLAVGRWAGVGCCNPGCCSTGGWGDGRKLKTCSGCRVAKFCSQECLKQDWARHKLACRVLAQRGSRSSAG